MSRSIQTQRSWNELGRFYGINPRVLAAYNNDYKNAQGGLAEKSAKNRRVKIPNARQLQSFHRSEKFRERFNKEPSHQHLQLPTPALTVQGALAPKGEVSELSSGGKQEIVTAIRMRRFSHAGDNYSDESALRSPNPKHVSNRGRIDTKPIEWLKGFYKCNILVGDAMYAAGYNWPMSQGDLYIQPKGLMLKFMLPDSFPSNRYVDAVWVAARALPGGSLENTEDFGLLKDAEPGDVLLWHDPTGGKPGHSSIVTGLREGEDGRLRLRVCDIYGEYWIRPSDWGHDLAGVFRPKARRSVSPYQSVGGNIDNPGHFDEMDEARLKSGLDNPDLWDNSNNQFLEDTKKKAVIVDDGTQPRVIPLSEYFGAQTPVDLFRRSAPFG